MHYFFLAALFFISLARSENEMIRVRFEYFETDHATQKAALNSIFSHAIVLSKLNENKATRYNTEVITTKTETTASLETYQDYIYLSEYDSHGVFFQNGKISSFLSNPAILNRPHPYIYWKSVHLGTQLEVTPSRISNLIKLQLSARDDALQRMVTYTSCRDYRGRADLTKPVFSAQSTNLTAEFVPDQPLLIASFTPRTDSGSPDSSRTILLFVTATVISTP